MTYTLLCDFDEDGFFSDELDEISAEVEAFDIWRRVDVYERVSWDVGGWVRVRNTDNAFSMETMSALALAVGKWLQFKLDATVLYTGLLDRIEINGLRSATLYLIGRLGRLGDNSILLQRSEASDRLVTRALRRAGVAEPRRTITGAYYAYLDDPDVFIDNCRIYPDDLLVSTTEAGLTDLLYGVSSGDARATVRDAIRAEWGWLVERADDLAILNRHYVFGAVTSAGVVTDAAAVGYDYRAGYTRIDAQIAEREQRLNQQVWVTTQDRSVTRGINYWRLPVRQDGGRVYLDAVSGSALSFTGTDIQTVIRAEGDSLTLWINNRDNAPATLSAGSSINADGYYESAYQLISASRIARPAGVRVLNLGSLDMQPDDALSLATFILNGEREGAAVWWIELPDAALAGVDLLDVITITFSAWDHSADYRVRGVRVFRDAHITRWRFEVFPMLDDVYLLIDVAGRNLIDTHYIAW